MSDKKYLLNIVLKWMPMFHWKIRKKVQHKCEPLLGLGPRVPMKSFSNLTVPALRRPVFSLTSSLITKSFSLASLLYRKFSPFLFILCIVTLSYHVKIMYCKEKNSLNALLGGNVDLTEICRCVFALLSLLPQILSHAHTLAHTHTCTHAHLHTRTLAHTHTSTHAHAHTHTH